MRSIRSFLLFVNGEVTQGLDTNHREVRITDCAKAGDRYVIDLQAYTGRDNDHNQGSTSHLRLSGSMMQIDPEIQNCYYNLNMSEPYCKPSGKGRPEPYQITACPRKGGQYARPARAVFRFVL